jgi:hypothetical protein
MRIERLVFKPMLNVTLQTLGQLSVKVLPNWGDLGRLYEQRSSSGTLPFEFRRLF